MLIICVQRDRERAESRITKTKIRVCAHVKKHLLRDQTEEGVWATTPLVVGERDN